MGSYADDMNCAAGCDGGPMRPGRPFPEVGNVILHPFELRELKANGEVELVRPIVPAPTQFTTVTPAGSVWPLDDSARRMRCAVGNPGEEFRVLEAWGYRGCSTMGDNHRASVQYLVDDVRREVTFFTFEEMSKATPEQHIEYPEDWDELDEWEREHIHDKLLNQWWKDIKTCAAETMPKWACRYLLRVEKVRCCRLNELVWRGERSWEELYPDCPAENNPWCWVAVCKPRIVAK